MTANTKPSYRYMQEIPLKPLKGTSYTATGNRSINRHLIGDIIFGDSISRGENVGFRLCLRRIKK